ncbi:MAG: YkgJ family cysteine cluster protein [Patescibacteria group bacterium]|nr:YkgJ family cysteine cluster protein [Patescibacteria group bacterium]
MNYLKFCSKCKDNCCCLKDDEEGIIFIGILDAIKIKKKTGKDFSEFLDFSKLTSSAIKKNIEKSYRKMLLDHRLLRMKKKKNGACVFLNKLGVCSIHNFRPLICRLYPFDYYPKKGAGFFNEIPECPIQVKYKGTMPLSKSEINRLKKIKRDMRIDDNFYIKNIKKFSNDNKLLSK